MKVWVADNMDSGVDSVSTNLNAPLVCWLLGGLLAVLAALVPSWSPQPRATLCFAAAAIGFIGIALVHAAAAVSVVEGRSFVDPTWLTRPWMLALWSLAALPLLLSGMLALIRIRQASVPSA
jgi:hypothetical protein